MNGPRYAWRQHRICHNCGRGWWTAREAFHYLCPDCR